jgi:hypothetical protein
MASVYTTARGKNKKNKAKDQSKNGAQCRANKFDSDLAKEMGVVKEETLGAALEPRVSGLTSTAYRLRMENERRLREQALHTCSNPACPSAPTRAEAAAASAGAGEQRGEEQAEQEEDGDESEEDEEEQAASAAGFAAAAAAAAAARAAAGGGGGGGGAAAGAAPAAPPALQRCACRLAAYCSTACQRAAWEEHKGPCKAKRAEMAEIAQAVALARERAEADALAAEAALLQELGAEEAAAAGGGKARGSKL